MATVRDKPLISRSENMARVRSVDTRPELLLRRILWKAGVRYRVRLKLPGTPDLAIPRRKVAVFLDGCFWHGCPQHYSAPASRFEFWAKKLLANVRRDAEVDHVLASMGWAVIRFWQHDLRDPVAVAGRILAPADPGVAISAMTMVREGTAQYADPWWSCACGCPDVRVLAVDGPGVLKAAAAIHPGFAWLRCRACGREWQGEIGNPGTARLDADRADTKAGG